MEGHTNFDSGDQVREPNIQRDNQAGNLGGGLGPNLQEQVFPWSYVPMDFRIPIFCGVKQSPNDPSFLEWKAEVETAFKMWRIPPDHSVELLLRYLGGEAKREVLVSGKKKTLAEIFQLLGDIYDGQMKLTDLLSKFYARTQVASETVRGYALSLQELAVQIEKISPENMGDKILRDKFVEGLYRPHLKFALKKAVRANGNVTFEEAKAECIILEKESQTIESTEFDVSVQYQKATNAATSTKNDPHAVMKSLEALQKQVDYLQNHLMGNGQTQPTPYLGPNYPQGRWQQPTRQDERGPKFRFTNDGTPICFKCNEAGHIGRNCTNFPRRNHPGDRRNHRLN